MEGVEDFEKRYTATGKGLKPSEEMDSDSQSGQYETFGNDLDYVKTFPNQKRVWTVIDGDDNNLYITAGYCIVNRVCYVISDQEWKDESEEYMWCEFVEDECDDANS